ncbi:regulatory LuxR family protein [Streptomyces sp. TLI_235]|nr:helix-turn-helix transcriptional regulator [Streptomyces sp. TLI_235]PBC66213.1 regulatory LuxR family protein [Streptomyces sp. TLI_235]
MDISYNSARAVVEADWQEADVAVYEWVLEHGHLDPAVISADLRLTEDTVRGALARLVAARLVQPDLHDPAEGFAVSPEVAGAQLAAPVRSRIREAEEQLARAHEVLEQFTARHARHLRHGSGHFRVITSMLEVRLALTEAAQRCSEEVLSSQPGGGSRVVEAMDEAMERDRKILERGVRMRTLYHHTARFNGPSQAYVAAASAIGAEYRTAHELFGRLVIFDRKLAFIPPDDGTRGAIAISEPSVVAYLAEIFEQAWAHATPFVDAASQGLGQVAREVDRTILRLLAAGLKDESIARRLGMSLRTVRRHIADVMEQLRVDSRFQAGVAAARGGLLDGDEPLAAAPVTVIAQTRC